MRTTHLAAAAAVIVSVGTAQACETLDEAMGDFRAVADAFTAQAQTMSPDKFPIWTSQVQQFSDAMGQQNYPQACAILVTLVDEMELDVTLTHAGSGGQTAEQPEPTQPAPPPREPTEPEPTPPEPQEAEAEPADPAPRTSDTDQPSAGDTEVAIPGPRSDTTNPDPVNPGPAQQEDPEPVTSEAPAETPATTPVPVPAGDGGWDTPRVESEPVAQPELQPQPQPETQPEPQPQPTPTTESDPIQPPQPGPVATTGPDAVAGGRTRSRPPRLW